MVDLFMYLFCFRNVLLVLLKFIALASSLSRPNGFQGTMVDFTDPKVRPQDNYEDTKNTIFILSMTTW